MVIRKYCPKCGWALALRVNKATGRDFLGCAQYPECDHTEPVPEDVKMREAGAATLPGFDDVT